jgi:predicted nucleic acid-binding protein
MNYLIDTCVISELIKSKPCTSVVSWINQCEEESLYLSVLTIGEIQKGIAKLSDLTRRDKLQHWLDYDLHTRFTGRIIQISEEVACTWGIMQAIAEQKGTSIPSIDGLIGATAIAHNYTLVTRNSKDMLHTGARLLDPWIL